MRVIELKSIPYAKGIRWHIRLDDDRLVYASHFYPSNNFNARISDGYFQDKFEDILTWDCIADEILSLHRNNESESTKGMIKILSKLGIHFKTQIKNSLQEKDEFELFRIKIKTNPIVRGINVSNIYLNYPSIETQNLILRKPNENDIPEIYSIIQEPLIKKYYKSPEENYNDINLVRQMFYEIPIQSFRQLGLISWVIVRKTDNKIIGIRDCFIDNVYEKPIELQGFIAKDFRNKGYGTEALIGAIKFFYKNGVKKFQANSYSNNIPSVTILQKVGFKKTAEHPFMKIAVYNLFLT